MAHLADPNKSKIKMVALTDQDHANIVWYSPTSQNRKSDDVIISGMLQRFLRRDESRLARVIQFYSTDTNELITERRC